MLVTNNKSALYNGVNQQSPEHRNETQVEECINAYPTINNGLLKRNPTSVLNLSEAISYSKDMYTYEYDRGLLDGVEEKYSLQITPEQFQIIDVKSGSVKTKVNGGVVFEGSAEQYFTGIISPTSFSAITIKDTTFIVNKNKIVNMKMNSSIDSTSSSETTSIDIVFAGSYAPVKLSVESSNLIFNFISYTTTYTFYELSLIIDDKTIKINTKNFYELSGLVFDSAMQAKFEPIRMQNFIEYASVIIKNILGDDYSVYVNSNNSIQVFKNDSTLISFGESSFNTEIIHIGNSSFTNIDGEVDYASASVSVMDTARNTLDPSAQIYKRQAYLWVKSSNPTTAYSYTATITYKDSGGATQIVSQTVSETTTELAASAFGTAFNIAPFTTSVNGSIVQMSVVAPLEIISITTSDTYGNQAVIGWANEFSTHLDLPKTMPFTSTIKIVGTSDTNFKGYWLKSVNGVWEETLDPYSNTEIDSTTMPHIMTREFDSNGNVYFKLKAWDGLVNMRVGDSDTNKLPSFIGEKIKDIFFFKNRLGFITPYSCIMSEVGEYGNFFRTTVTTLLESDRIDTSVDSTQAIELEYATYLEDSLMLFSDKAQFKLEGGKVLSPSTVQISQTSAYEINKYVRPIFVNDKVFFCAKRGNYTAVMQYYVSGDGRISEAIDVTAHCDKYIPDDVTRLSFSSINNCVFLFSKSNPDTIFVYKYLDSNNQRVQSAWFKWVYNGEIYGIFSLGRNLNIMIQRYSNAKVSNWVLGTGIYSGEKLWTSSGIWYGSPSSLVLSNNFEIQPIHEINHNSYFVDASNIVNGFDNGSIIPVQVDLGEWVLMSGGKPNLSGTLKFKTCQISSEEGSDFGLKIANIKRNNYRIVKSKYTKDRRPMVYGDSKDVRLSIINNSSYGFRINSVTLEGNFNTRSRRS